MRLVWALVWASQTFKDSFSAYWMLDELCPHVMWPDYPHVRRARVGMAMAASGPWGVATGRRGVVWCGVVWCGVVWCGVVWCGVVWCGVVWCGVVWCGVVWCGVVWCGVVWCGVVWCGVVWCDVVWCGVVWCGLMGDNTKAGGLPGDTFARGDFT